MAEIVKFTGRNDELFCRESADNLHASAQVIVPETHTVLLIKDGVVSEALQPGRHDIFDKENGLFRARKDSDVATVDFVFVSKTAKLPMLWGTSSPIKTRDPITDVAISVGINGELEFRVATPKKFYLELVGADTEYNTDKLKRRILNRLLGIIEPAVTSIMRTERKSYTEFAQYKGDIAVRLKQKIDETLHDEYGLEVCSFSINGIYISESDAAAIERARAELKAVRRTCRKCGATVGLDGKFCPECGENLVESYCSNCGAKLDANAKFCSQCGKRIDA